MNLAQMKKIPPKQSPRKPEQTSRVRIIGGLWRRRWLRFDASGAVRPTPDKLRETLFNWLQPWIDGAICLDLFAGSGALGFEAVSRGAARALLVEQSSRAVQLLEQNRQALQTDAVEVRPGRVEDFLRHSASSLADAPFNLVFIDPPFGSPQLAQDALSSLERGDLLAGDALVYIETSSGQPPPVKLAQADPSFSAWHPLRTCKCGRTTGHLYRCGEPLPSRFSPAKAS